MTEISGGGMERKLAERREAANAECKRRILDVIDYDAQTNIQGEAIAGRLTNAQMQTFADGTAWIHLMRAACHGFYSDLDADLYDDANWPDCPADVAALAAIY